MKYLVLSKDNFEMMNDLQDVRVKALVATFEWCHSPNYVGDEEDWRELYKECIKDNDFGDIMKVYEITPIKANVFTEFNYCKVGDTFQLKRVL